MADQSSAFVSGVFLGGLVVAVAAYVLCQADREHPRGTFPDLRGPPGTTTDIQDITRDTTRAIALTMTPDTGGALTEEGHTSQYIQRMPRIPVADAR